MDKHDELGSFSFGPELDKEMNNLYTSHIQNEATQEVKADQIDELSKKLDQFIMSEKVDTDIRLQDFLSLLTHKEKILRGLAAPEEETTQQ